VAVCQQSACLSGACQAQLPFCAPFTSATNLGGGRISIVAAGSEVRVADELGASLYLLDTAQPSLPISIPLAGTPIGIATNGSRLFWVNHFIGADLFIQSAFSGHNPVLLDLTPTTIIGSSEVGQSYIDGWGDILFAITGSNQITRVVSDGVLSMPPDDFEVGSFPGNVIVDDSYVYWTENDFAGRIKRMELTAPTVGYTIEALQPVPNFGSGFTWFRLVDVGDRFIVSVQVNAASIIAEVSKNPLTPARTLVADAAEGSARVPFVAADDAYVYFIAQNAAAHGLWALRRDADAAPFLLYQAGTVDQLRGLAATPDYLVFTERSGGGEGALLMMEKPAP
jgi:hypothetical protein